MGHRRSFRWTRALVAGATALAGLPLLVSPPARADATVTTATLTGTSYEAWLVQTGSTPGQLTLNTTGGNEDIESACVVPTQYTSTANFGWCETIAYGSVQADAGGTPVSQGYSSITPSGNLAVLDTFVGGPGAPISCPPVADCPPLAAATTLQRGVGGWRPQRGPGPTPR